MYQPKKKKKIHNIREFKKKPSVLRHIYVQNILLEYFNIPSQVYYNIINLILGV